MHAIKAVLRQVFETFRRGDREAVSRMFSEVAIFGDDPAAIYSREVPDA